jgi:hypothetical protein
MTKLKWDREPVRSSLNSEYWLNPKKGFDKAWHIEQANNTAKKEKLEKSLGEHLHHNWQAIQHTTGPHEGKAICNTCGGKFIMWLPKGYFN